MIIISDTREQSVLDFPYEFVSEVRREKLPVGDYACEFSNGFKPPVYWERKSHSDLYGTMGKGFKRFKKEILRAKELNIKLMLIIEKPLGTILKGYEKSDLKGESVVRRIFMLMVKYEIYPVFCKDRDEMSRYIYEFYCAIGRLMVKQSKENKVSNAELPSIPRLGDIQVRGSENRGDSRGVNI